MDFSKIFATRSIRVEEFKDLDFKLSNYVISSYYNVDSYSYDYLIEFQNSKGIGVYKTFDKSVWLAMKNYFQIGSGFKCDGLNYYDEKNDLYYIEIKSFKYKDLYISKDELVTPKGNVRITRTLRTIFEDKIMLILLIIFLAGFLISFSISGFFLELIHQNSLIIIFILLFIDLIVLIIYVGIKNKRMGKKVDSKLKEIGLQKLEQDFIKRTKN